jgi:UDP-glucose 4-epimerase
VERLRVPNRVLITGLSSFWGGRIAQAVERHPDVEIVVGIDTEEPTVPFERTEFVRTDESYSILDRLVRATQIDTVVHAGLAVDSTILSAARLHERNVIATMNLLGALGAEGSQVRSLVVKSSTLIYGTSARDPVWFSEQDARLTPARTPVERSLVEAESYVNDFAEERPGVKVAVLRCANVLGAQITTASSNILRSALVPRITGFDPQVQFVEQHDVVRAILFALQHRLGGVYNVAGDGRVPWSEVLVLAGRRPLMLPPVGTALAARAFSALGLAKVPPELLDLLRFGRGVDNSRLKRAGFHYRYNTAGAVQHFAGAQRVGRIVGDTTPRYRYESDVEAFFRHSPAVVRATEA